MQSSGSSGARILRIHDHRIQTKIKEFSGLKGSQLKKLTHFGKVMDTQMPDRTLRVIIGLKESPSLIDLLDENIGKKSYAINGNGFIVNADPSDAEKILKVLKGRTGLEMNFPDRLNSYPIAFLTAKTGIQKQGMSAFFTYDTSDGFGVRPLIDPPGVGAWFKAADAEINRIKLEETGILLISPLAKE